jgi:hypothetical protein
MTAAQRPATARASYAATVAVTLEVRVALLASRSGATYLAQTVGDATVLLAGALRRAAVRRAALVGLTSTAWRPMEARGA